MCCVGFVFVAWSVGEGWVWPRYICSEDFQLSLAGQGLFASCFVRGVKGDRTPCGCVMNIYLSVLQ